ncbi:MAG: cupin domain-containing protein [Candidatus Marinimicrobia bacterium]|nr:cupin domain-containing protein [Candidatus Neomarinimicrobiota bacterium]
MIIKSLKNVPQGPVNMEGVKNAFRQVPIGKADGSPNISFRVFTLEPDGHTPFHIHESEHVNYIISGQGAIKDENGELHPIKKGDFSLIMPGEKHQYLNVSETENMVFICAVLKEYE